MKHQTSFGFWIHRLPRTPFLDNAFPRAGDDSASRKLGCGCPITCWASVLASWGFRGIGKLGFSDDSVFAILWFRTGIRCPPFTPHQIIS